MSEKKKGLFGGLFKTSGGCNCGVQIVEEKEEKPQKKKDKTTSDNKNKK